MAGVGKCMGIVAGTSFLLGTAGSYYMQSKANKVAMAVAQTHAKNGKLPIGGRTPDGKLWDGEISLEDYQKQLKKRSAVTSAIMGGLTALGTAVVSGLTLLVKSKL